MVLTLDLNERVAGQSPYARQADYVRARARVARYCGVPAAAVCITNGSYHALDLIFGCVFREADRILLPVPTFAFYDKWRPRRRLIKLPCRTPEQVLERILASGPARGLYLANPNNPLGYQLSRKQLSKILTAKKLKRALVIVDEAYFEFSGVTVVDLISRFPNLVVLRSFSKAFGLAGLRAGCLIANPVLIAQLEKLKGPPYIIGRPALETLGKLSPKLTRSATAYARRIDQSRRSVSAALDSLDFKFFAGNTNFVTFITRDSGRAVRLLKRSGVWATNLASYPDVSLLKNAVRLTLPPPALVPALLLALKKL